MANNVMESILSIEMSPMVVDSSTSSNYIMIQTHRNRYCFRLSDKISLQEQYEMFRSFIADVNTPLPQPEEKKAQWTMDSAKEEPKQEKHDGSKLFDEPPTQPTDVEITVKHPVATQD